ncbi:hypothetical protein [Streptomyces sp. NPDC102462]
MGNQIRIGARAQSYNRCPWAPGPADSRFHDCPGRPDTKASTRTSAPRW